MSVALKISNWSTEQNVGFAERIQDRALFRGEFSFAPYSCFIEYREKDRKTNIEYKDCVIDYTRCSNQKCIKKLV